MLLRPRSNGYIRLRSADPHDKPLIYPNYLVDEQDSKVLVDGVKIAIAVGATDVSIIFSSSVLSRFDCQYYKF